MITLGAARALKERGLSHTVALAGFDDFPAADLLEPGVTVMRQDVPLLGLRAIEQLLARIDGDAADPVITVLPTLMVVRGSGEIAAPGIGADPTA